MMSVACPLFRSWPRLLANLLTCALLSTAVSAAAVEAREPIAIDAPADRVARTENPLRVTGRAPAGAPVVVRLADEAGREVASWPARADNGGQFRLEIDRAGLPAGAALRWQVRREGAEPWADSAPFFVYPVLDETKLPGVRAEGRQLLIEGRPWGFAGLNYTRFLIEFSIRSNFQRVVQDLQTHAEWGVSVVRVPLHLGMIQPAPGVFPDDPRYPEVLRAHKLDVQFYELLEYFIDVAGSLGIRVVLEWHEMPTDPYRYFVGGNHHDKGTGRPGRGIAWLVDPETGRAAEPGDPAFLKALATTNRWLARRLRGNGTILGFEVPYNEPHSVSDSSDTAWRRLASGAAAAIRQEDPERLTFGMPPAWGHNNVLPSVTWLLPDLVTGMAPHYYLGNGPVPARPDAPERKEPWLARNVADTFAHSFAAVALPHSAAPYPVWNGESGEHGYQSFLPDLDRDTAASYMIEAQLVQAYAAGMAGSLGWTLTGHETVYEPLRDIYRQAYQRFGPVFNAGPVDYTRAQVLFVQNPGAVPIQNGLNHAVVPLAKLALDLHLAPVHYMTDDQLLADGLVQISVGLEQVEQVASGLNYRAAIVDTRNLDARALALLESSQIPLLTTDDAARLGAAELAGFLTSAGLDLDRRTPPEMQLILGPQHLLVYRRSGDGTARVYPQLAGEGELTLVDEAGKVAFAGTVQQLAEQGLPVHVPKWRTVIFEIRWGSGARP